MIASRWCLIISSDTLLKLFVRSDDSILSAGLGQGGKMLGSGLERVRAFGIRHGPEYTHHG